MLNAPAERTGRAEINRFNRGAGRKAAEAIAFGHWPGLRLQCRPFSRQPRAVAAGIRYLYRRKAPIAGRIGHQLLVSGYYPPGASL